MEGSTGTQQGLGTQRVAPLDLNQSKLDLLVDALGPAYVRVGGSEADKVEYFTSQKPLSEKQHDGLLLSQTMWDNLHHFCQRHDLALIFTLKYGLFERRKQGRWDATEVIDLLKYSQAHQQQIDICELGNELNAYWAFHGFTHSQAQKT